MFDTADKKCLLVDLDFRALAGEVRGAHVQGGGASAQAAARRALVHGLHAQRQPHPRLARRARLATHHLAHYDCIHEQKIANIHHTYQQPLSPLLDIRT